jgi:hypothetical protein
MINPPPDMDHLPWLIKSQDDIQCLYDRKLKPSTIRTPGCNFIFFVAGCEFFLQTTRLV